MHLVGRTTVVVRREDQEAIERHLEELVEDKILDSKVKVVVDPDPKGQAASTMVGLLECDPLEPVLIANCDQYFIPRDRQTWDRQLLFVLGQKVDSCFPVFTGSGRKWSYAGVVQSRSDFQVMATVEKPERDLSETGAWKPIVGVFIFSRCELISGAIQKMMNEQFTINGEFYTAPALNYLIRTGRLVEPTFCDMWGIGTPEDVKVFREMDIQLR
jgi:hypothetical protein